MFFGAAYYPEHRDPGRWTYDLDHMARASVNCLRVGEFAWDRFEPEDGRYDFAWMDRFLAEAWKRGIGLLLCPPLRTLPAWLVEKDPSVRIEREDGVVLEYGSRYSFCINHPLVLDRGAALADAMARHYGRCEGVRGWHLDNEHGDEPDCHCPLCRTGFQQFCRERYGEIEELNRAWGLDFWSLRFNRFEQVPTPRVSKAFHSPGHLLAWRRYRSQSTIRAMVRQIEAVNPHRGTGQFLTTNNQVLHNRRTDYFDMARHLNITGTNYYPPYGRNSRASSFGLANVRGYKAGQGFQVHELRNGPHMIPGLADNTPGPGEVERLALHCVGNGATGLFFFRWRACPFGCEQHHGTITDYDGRPHRIYAEVQRVGARLKDLAGRLDATRVESRVGILFDFPTRWVMEVKSQWNGPTGLYVDTCRTVYAAIRKLAVNCDSVGRDQDWSRYKLLVVPGLATVDDALAGKIRRFVEAGGILVTHPLCGVKDDEARIYPDRIHPALRELLGIDVREYATFGEKETSPFTWNGRQWEGTLFCDLPELTGATAVAQFSREPWAGVPAVTRTERGKGKAYHLATFPRAEFYEVFFRTLLDEAGIEPILPAGVPEAVEIVERRGDGERLVFLLNHTELPQTVRLPGAMKDIYRQERLEGEVELPPYGARILAEKISPGK
ncbi:MAG TPA: hypothetical protein DCX07_06370 [Phycisphaerales bacterium]|nr:hypothetical protein [Phycisphaerales bacterium]